MFPLIWSWWQGESPVCIISESDNFEATRVAYGSGMYVRISARVAVLSEVCNMQRTHACITYFIVRTQRNVHYVYEMQTSSGAQCCQI
jgi:hypothetical protein